MGPCGGSWSFDRSLRLLCLDAAEIIEVGVRTRLAYVLGRRDRMGHIHLESLDGKKCAKNVHGRTALSAGSKLTVI
ncbi:Abi family protein [Kocuria atrinae]|uniref:Abi family protein n=1 Tax=Kocuria atrinae TaxID=592377 RepID=UPI0037C0ACBF